MTMLDGRVGVILGVSGRNSLGYQCAQAFTAMGARVAITYRPARTEGGGALAGELDCAAHFPLEAQDEAGLTRVAAALTAEWGRLDFLVHTWMHVPHGVLRQPLVDLGRDEFHEVLDTGVYSLILACRHLSPLLARSAQPRVVAFTSACAEQMTPGYHVAGVSKAALVAALRYLAYELGPQGIMCNAVSFSLLPTDGANRAVGAEVAARTHDAITARSATHLPLSPRHVTGAAAYLCSELSGNMTGEVLTVDGGFSRVYFRA